jgi:hypothetical protein
MYEQGRTHDYREFHPKDLLELLAHARSSPPRLDLVRMIAELTGRALAFWDRAGRWT